MVRRFRQTYEVRYDECNLYGFVTPAAILRYLQDIAGLDASRASLLIDGGDWVARRTVLEFKQQITPRATLEIETYPRGFTKVTAQRSYDVYQVGEGPENQEPVVIARTLWVFLNERGRPARIPATYQQFWELSGGSPLQEEAEWPAYPAREPFTTNAPVRFSDLDVMSHMNNTAYVELLDNAGWEAFASIGLLPDSGLGYPAPLYYDIEYLESAKAGETLQVHSWFEPVAGAPGQWERLQRVERGGTALVRARSRWQWEQQAEPTPAFEQLWKG